MHQETKLDSRIAREVMGWVETTVSNRAWETSPGVARLKNGFRPSSNWEDALEVVCRMRRLGWSLKLETNGRSHWMASFSRIEQDIYFDSENPLEAVCAAALHSIKSERAA